MIKNSPSTETEICLKDLYGNDEKVIAYQVSRYKNLRNTFEKQFKSNHLKYFSAPGRTELGGNHTDHNNGIVIAAGINLDSIACVAEGDSEVEIYSYGYNEPFKINLDNLNPVEEENGTTRALIRGIAAGLSKRGYKIGGFKASITSEVFIGSGLSSSASMEILIGNIFNHLYNEAKIPLKEIALIGQYAENKFFKKPCGLMDQITCAVGGIVSIDFKDKNNPEINKIKFDFSKHNYSLIVVHTGGSHINLTDAYAAIPREMRQVAKALGKETCGDVDYNYFMESLSEIRRKVSDRAILRAYHFFKENERVKNQVEALKENNFTEFLQLVNDSGDSSLKWLQNIYSPIDINYQPVTLALALTENFIKDLGEGACRIHGGGFEGTILAFLPTSSVEDFKKYLLSKVNNYTILNLAIRQVGMVAVNEVDPKNLKTMTI